MTIHRISEIRLNKVTSNNNFLSEKKLISEKFENDLASINLDNLKLFEQGKHIIHINWTIWSESV